MEVAVILISLTLPSFIPTGLRCRHEHFGSGVVGSFVAMVTAGVVDAVVGKNKHATI